MTMWNQLLLQDPTSKTTLKLIMLHDHAMLIATLVLSMVAYVIINLFKASYMHLCRTIISAHMVETVWTIIPALILQALAIPSLRLLYFMDEVSHPSLTLKIIGHQWYWSYEYMYTMNNYTNIKNMTFDAFMLPTNLLMEGQYRLLEVDKRAILPINEEIRFMITSADVIHSWAIPSLSVKVDAVPGRLNQSGTIIDRPGIFYGQCSEICGANHSFMPIVIEATPVSFYKKWLLSMD